MFASSRDYRDSIDVVDNGLLKKAYVLYLDIADEAADFVEQLAALYQNEAELVRRSKASYQYIRDNFSFENAKKVIGPEFDLE